MKNKDADFKKEIEKKGCLYIQNGCNNTPIKLFFFFLVTHSFRPIKSYQLELFIVSKSGSSFVFLFLFRSHGHKKQVQTSC